MHIDNVLKALKISSSKLLYVLAVHQGSVIKLNNNMLDYIFQNINSSILAGEFIKDENTFNKTLKDCIEELDFISNLYEEISINYPNLISTKVENLCFNSVTIIGNFLNQLEELKNRVFSFFDKKNNDILLNRSLEGEKIENFALALLAKSSRDDKILDEKKTKMCYEILGINKQVFILDFFLDVTKKSYYKLEFYENELKKYYNLGNFKKISFISVLLEKVIFLKLKLLLRFKKSYLDEGNELKLILDNKVVSIESIFAQLSVPELQNLLEYANCHYIETRDNKRIINENFLDLKDKTGSKPIHCKIKYYKDISFNYQELVNISNTIEINNSSSYNRYTSILNKLYSINNTYSAVLSQNNAPFENIVKEYEKVKETLQLFRVNNYFGESKLLEYIIDKVENLLNNKSNSEKLNASEILILGKYIDKAVEVLEDYKRNINWSGFNYSFLFPLSYSEAIIDDDFIKNNKVECLFISSGFCLPLDYQHYKDELALYSQKIFTFKSILPQIEKLYTEITNVEKLEKEYEKKDSKYIEILGIFSSIIIFASAAFNVSIDLSNKLDLKNIILVFMSIGIVLILFLILVLLIARFSFRKVEYFLLKHKNRGKLFYFTIILLYFLFFILCYNLIDVLKYIVIEVERINLLRIAN